VREGLPLLPPMPLPAYELPPLPGVPLLPDEPLLLPDVPDDWPPDLPPELLLPDVPELPDC
jgi:hypothetical protein